MEKKNKADRGSTGRAGTNAREMGFRNLDRALRVLNELQREKLIGDYAIGGAVATIYYVQPFLTVDLDVFASLPETPDGLVILTPIYNYLRKKGYRASGTHILVGDMPMQFIPISSALETEALQKAKAIKYKGVGTRIIRSEYLVAIFLRSYRLKDQTKIEMLLDQADIDMGALTDIIGRHDLRARWDDFMRRYGKQK
jgi:hypothetical protein